LETWIDGSTRDLRLHAKFNYIRQQPARTLYQDLGLSVPQHVKIPYLTKTNFDGIV